MTTVKSATKNPATGLYDIHVEEGLINADASGTHRISKDLVQGNKPLPTKDNYMYLSMPDIDQMPKEAFYAFLQVPFSDMESGKYATASGMQDMAKDYPMPPGFCLTNDQIDPCPLNICCPPATQPAVGPPSAKTENQASIATNASKETSGGPAAQSADVGFIGTVKHLWDKKDPWFLGSVCGIIVALVIVIACLVMARRGSQSRSDDFSSF